MFLKCIHLMALLFEWKQMYFDNSNDQLSVNAQGITFIPVYVDQNCTGVLIHGLYNPF